MLKKIFISLTFIILILSSILTAQTSSDQKYIDSEFDLALRLYKANQYNDAYEIFNRIINEFKLNSKTTPSFVFKGKVLLAEKKYNEAVNTLQDFVSKYPGSKYLNEARATLADVYFQKEDYINALKQFGFIIESPDSGYYNAYARKTGENIALNYLAGGQLELLYNFFTNSRAKSFFLLLAGEVYQHYGDIVDAKIALSELIQSYPNSDESAKAQGLLNGGLSTAPIPGNRTLIGVMLPMRTKTDDKPITAGLEILEGIKFAVSEFNQSRDENNKIGIIIRNTEDDVQKILQIKNEFISTPGIKVVLGPVYSNEVQSALNAFKDVSIPIISPTATDDSLTLMNQNFFQANPSFEMRGKNMAQYLYYVENKRRMAVLNAIDGYSPDLANAFIDEFQKLGGEIIIKETYQSKTYNLSEQVSELLTFADTLEGIYVPISNKIDAPVILSALAQDSLFLPLYGNQDWFLAKGFESSPELSNNLTFESDYFIDYSSAAYQDFSKRFSARTNRDPNRNILYGYDLARYVLNILRIPNSNTDSIELKMESGFLGTGFHNNIAFGTDRVNRFLNVVRYRNGIFELVDKFRVGE
jgi:branched-chain amino acid transport system substrate-binding protein